jgi:hypothetical protein
VLLDVVEPRFRDLGRVLGLVLLGDLPLDDEKVALRGEGAGVSTYASVASKTSSGRCIQ